MTAVSSGVDMARDATFLASEAMVFGCHVLGEAVSARSFRGRWRRRRDGRLVFAEDFEIASRRTMSPSTRTHATEGASP